MFTGVFRDKRVQPTGIGSPDAVLGRLLQAKSLRDWRFQRRVSIGPFVVDYACLEQALVIEVADMPGRTSGAYNTDARGRFLDGLGYRVTLVTKRELFQHPDRVISRVRAQLR